MMYIYIMRKKRERNSKNEDEYVPGVCAVTLLWQISSCVASFSHSALQGCTLYPLNLPLPCQADLTHLSPGHARDTKVIRARGISIWDKGYNLHN